MSFSQNLRTVRPCSFSFSLTVLSLSKLRCNFLIQNSLFVLGIYFPSCKYFPCQNSLSQKIAIFLDLKHKSGFPITSLQFFCTYILFSKELLSKLFQSQYLWILCASCFPNGSLACSIKNSVVPVLHNKQKIWQQYLLKMEMKQKQSFCIL